MNTSITPSPDPAPVNPQRSVEVMDIAASTRNSVAGLINLTVRQALEHLRPGVATDNFSVFVNRTPIPPTQFDNFTLSPGDVLGFMTNKQGGNQPH